MKNLNNILDSLMEFNVSKSDYIKGLSENNFDLFATGIKKYCHSTIKDNISTIEYCRQFAEMLDYTPENVTKQTVIDYFSRMNIIKEEFCFLISYMTNANVEEERFPYYKKMWTQGIKITPKMYDVACETFCDWRKKEFFQTKKREFFQLQKKHLFHNKLQEKLLISLPSKQVKI